MPTQVSTTLTRSIASAFVAALLLTAGCGGESESKYEDFEQLQLRDPLVEVPMGHYSIPVPVTLADESGKLVRMNLMQLKFTLFGLVKPEFESDALRVTERHEGRLRDQVIRVCRSSSVDDLVDPQLSTLKSRILDSTQPLLDGVTLRRMLITERMLEPL